MTVHTRHPHWKTARNVLLILFLIVLTLVVANRRMIVHIYHGYNLFQPEKMVESFRSLEEKFPNHSVAASDQPYLLAYDRQDLPEYYLHSGDTKSIQRFMAATDTTGLLITNGTNILYEEYFDGRSPENATVLWSVSKSVVSALVGIALAEGYINSLDEMVTQYVPELVGSGYANVAIKDVLQMSSGIRFNEDYVDASSEFNRMAPRSIGLGGPLAEVLVSLENELEPGTYNRYVSADAQVLGMVLRQAVGMSLAEYTTTRLWQPAGMEHNAFWLVDSSGMESAFGGFNASLRDMGRFGGIYLNKGFGNGQPILPADWVLASRTADGEHLVPGSNSQSDSVMGYGYQWWLPQGNQNDFLALGIHGQAVYVNLDCRIVIVKTSAYKGYYEDGQDMELESVSFFRAIASQMGEGCSAL